MVVILAQLQLRTLRDKVTRVVLRVLIIFKVLVVVVPVGLVQIRVVVLPVVLV